MKNKYESMKSEELVKLAKSMHDDGIRTGYIQYVELYFIVAVLEERGIYNWE